MLRGILPLAVSLTETRWLGEGMVARERGTIAWQLTCIPADNPVYSPASHCCRTYVGAGGYPASIVYNLKPWVPWSFSMAAMHGKKYAYPCSACNVSFAYQLSSEALATNGKRGKENTQSVIRMRETFHQ